MKQIKHIKDVNTLHELIAIAIADARAVMEVAGFEAHYKSWYKGTGGDDPCYFCLAGAIIVKDFDYSNSEGTFDMTDFPGETYSRLHALDSVRVGDWNRAFMCMHGYAADDYGKVEKQASMFQMQGLAEPAYATFRNNARLAQHLDHLECLLPEIKEAELKALAVEA